MPGKITAQPRLAHLLRFLIPLGLCLTLLTTACAPNKFTAMEEPELLTAQGMDLFNRGSYFSALEAFKQVQNQYPFSKFSLLAELKSADSHFYMSEYSEALTSYEDFAGKHPTNEAIPYVLFQIGMCHVKGIDTIDRDTSTAHEAIAVFTKLLRTYPKSSYVVEAKARVTTARDFLARHEFYVARFYLRAEKWEAAEARLEFIVQQYPESSVAAKARELLSKAQLRQEGGVILDDNQSVWQRLFPAIFPS